MSSEERAQVTESFLNEEPKTVSNASKRSLKKYAFSVFKESLITGLSAIIQADSIVRKIFKSLVLLICIAGFLYQAVTFISYILTYPSVVDIKISRPEYFIQPAYTFCNNNGIKRSKFCTRYPKRCHTPVDVADFCHQFSGYCGERDEEKPVMMPTHEFLNYEKNMTQQDLLELGHDLNELLVDYSNGAIDNDDFSGPYLLSKGDFKGTDGYIGCFSKYARVKSALDPQLTKRTRIFKEPVDSFVFNMEEHETFLPDVPPGALFSLHSPFVAVNPFMDGILLKPGKSYKIHVRMEEERLLPYPYDTDCVNYTELWLTNNRTGPRTQEMCLHVCALNYSITCFGCVFPAILYPHKEEICSPGPNRMCPDINMEELQKCEAKCKDDCSKVIFHYDVQERYTVVRNRGEGYTQHKEYTFVDVYIIDSEVVAFDHRPQFQNVEAFSYIGGFIGVWLGISLIAVADFLESLFRITCYFFRLRR